MKRRFLFTAAVLTIVFTVFTNIPAYSAVDPDMQKSSAQVLSKLGLLHADSKGNLNLAAKMKRCEFISLIDETMSYDTAADVKNANVSFKDLSSKHWAYNAIKAAAVHGIISAYKDNTIRPDKYITYNDALDITLKALGYRNQDSDTAAAAISSMALETGLDKKYGLAPDKQLTRGEAAVIIYNALTIDYADL